MTIVSNLKLLKINRMPAFYFRRYGKKLVKCIRDWIQRGQSTKKSDKKDWQIWITLYSEHVKCCNLYSTATLQFTRPLNNSLHIMQKHVFKKSQDCKFEQIQTLWFIVQSRGTRCCFLLGKHGKHAVVWLTFRSGSSHTKITIFNDLDDSDCLAHQVPHSTVLYLWKFCIGLWWFVCNRGDANTVYWFMEARSIP